MLHVVLAEAELEPMPRELRGHPTVGKHAQREGKDPARLLLDSNYHHIAMRKLPEAERRGRPDIAHTCLVLAQDSVANLEGRLRVSVHTRNDEVLVVAPETRIMRTQHRFYGLVESLFEHGRAPRDPKEKALLTLEKGVTLAEAVRRTGARTVLGFQEKGERGGLERRLAEVVGGSGAPDAMPAAKGSSSGANGADVAVVIGAFPHGDFHVPLDFCTSVLSLHAKPLSAWTVLVRVLDAYERAAGLHG